MKRWFIIIERKNIRERLEGVKKIILVTAGTELLARRSGPFIVLLNNSIKFFLTSICLVLITCFINFLLTSFYISNTIIILKLSLGLTFLVFLSMIPFLGIYFIVIFPFYTIELVGFLSIPFEINVLISFILFFTLALIACVWNTYGFIIEFKRYFFCSKNRS